MIHGMKNRGRAITGVAVLLALIALAGWQINYQAANRAPQIGPMAPLQPGGKGPAPGAPGDSGKSSVVGVSTGTGIVVGQSYKNDVSPPLRDIPPLYASAQ